MMKRVLIAVPVVVIVLAAGVYFWADNVLSTETVRRALAAQFARALGQPVEIGSLHATIFPRVTVTLTGVRIGTGPAVSVGALHLETGLRALLSRRVEHGVIRVSGADVQLPLPPFTISGPGPDHTAGAAALEIASIDRLIVEDASVASAGRTMQAALDATMHGQTLTIHEATLGAGAATLRITGEMTSLSPPVGHLAVDAGEVQMDALVAFASDFARGAVSGAGPGATGQARSADLTFDLSARSARLGGLALDQVNGRAHMTSSRIVLEPISAGLFGGESAGALTFSFDAVPAFSFRSTVSHVDLERVMSFAGTPDLMTGRVSGTLNLAGRGTSVASVIPSLEGQARLAATNGVVARLGLVRSIVIRGSMRADTNENLAGERGTDEPFSALGGTFVIQQGVAWTKDLRFVSADVLLDAAGSIRVDGRGVDLDGTAQLSDALSRQAGRDLVRYTQQNGRVTLPLSISGSAGALHVRLDIIETTKRALINRAAEEAKQAIDRVLGR
jgi:uncharacterized protein involved in outer membrane biogenesis